MAFTNYTGNVPSALALNYTQNIPVSGGASISGSRIDSVIATLGMSTNAYANTYSVRVRLIDQYGGTLAETSRADIEFTSGNYGQAYFEFTFGTGFDVNAIKSIDVFGLSDASKIFVKSSQAVGITYTVRTACTPPSSVTLSRDSAEPSGAATLSWSGAGAGDANGITGYTIQRSINGAAWADWQTDNASPYTVTAHATYGNYYDYRIVTQGEYISSGPSASKRLLTLTPTDCGAPSTVTLAKTLANPNEVVNLSWSGASGGTINTIVGYTIQRRTGTGAYADWKTVNTTATSGSYNVAAHEGYDASYGYRFITRGSAGATYYSPTSSAVTLTTRHPTSCGAPTSASVAPSLSENNPTLNASGASGGTINEIVGYEIQYAESANNSTWGDWTALKTVSSGGTGVSTTVTISPTRGYYRKYRIRTQGSAGASYYSGWVATGSCRRNSQPTSHTSFSASPAVYVSGTITLTYSGATDADGNISTHNVQYATSADGVTLDGWASLANGATSHTPTLSPGYYIKYRARAVDAFGITSPAWVESNVCGKNTAPGNPTINHPQASKTIYNSRPRFLVTLGADPESHTMTLAASGFTLSRSSGLVGGSKIIARKTSAASAGAVSISATATDQYSESSSAAARSTTYAVPSFTDATVEAGTTPIKAAHINELRDMVNDVQKYYGLSTNLVANSSFASSYTGWSANQNVTISQVDWYHRVTCNQTTSTPGLITTANVDRSDFQIGSNYTINIYARSATGSDVSLAMNLFGNYVANVVAPSAGWVGITGTITLTSMPSPWMLIHFTSPTIGAAFDIWWIEITRGSLPFSSGNIVWPETITAGTTKSRNWQTHVLELQQSVSDVVELVNGWDTSSTINRIPAFTWLEPGVKPNAAVMEQIRQVIAWL